MNADAEDHCCMNESVEHTQCSLRRPSRGPGDLAQPEIRRKIRLFNSGAIEECRGNQLFELFSI